MAAVLSHKHKSDLAHASIDCRGLCLEETCASQAMCNFCRLKESMSGPLAALRKAARAVGTAAADAKLGVNVDDFVDRFR